MNIVFYDTEHFETTYAFVKTWDVPEHNITLFTTPEVAAVLKKMFGKDAGRYRWISKNKRNAFFIRDLYRYCRVHNVSLLVLTTVAHHHLLLALLCRLLKRTPTLLTIHDADSFFRPRLSLSLRPLVQYAGKNLLARWVKGYLALLLSVRDHIDRQYRPAQPVYCLPGGVYEGRQQAPALPGNGYPLVVVVPGSIDPQRRAYEQVLGLADALQYRQGTYELVLLGAAAGASGQAVLRAVAALQYKNVGIRYFATAFVEHADFEQELERCHLVWIPLQQAFSTGGRSERYGTTKSSGSFFDAVRHARPILVPDHIPLSPEIKDQCTTYSSPTDLADLLEKLSLEPDLLQQLAETAHGNALFFQPAAARTRMLRAMGN